MTSIMILLDSWYVVIHRDLEEVIICLSDRGMAMTNLTAAELIALAKATYVEITEELQRKLAAT